MPRPLPGQLLSNGPAGNAVPAASVALPVFSPGCWMLTKSVLPSGDSARPVTSAPFGAVRKRRNLLSASLLPAFVVTLCRLQQEGPGELEFGRHVGIAFQLQDDILDVYGDENKFGKKSGGDIVANKKTYLLLKAFECANRYQQEELQNWMMVTATDFTEKVAGVKALYDVLGVKKLAEEEMHLHYKAGIDALASVRADEKKKNVLKKFTDDLMVREH